MPSKVVDAPSLKAFKARLDEAVRELEVDDLKGPIKLKPF